ncbi:TonB-dependent receptor [Sphingomonas sp.]|uniref:TonB-dependent receptor n=1 Tax=Sphingomonas sp. TaxID=28214 RepID=UPI001EC37792|nr:TonB-dependent receptor [Sphingomonas sp.]MBX3595742.1 TonB-dependent receptor [Sphingomonas sp.]
MRHYLLVGAAAAALVAPGAAFAQSTGSVEFDDTEIVVTGQSGPEQVGGIQIPDQPKPKVVLDQTYIARQNPGQTILDTINVIPGVNFQNNDAYGSSGGTLTMRGFSSDRISLTFDGVPLNDSGNYAIYSNQQLDPEIIEQVNVSLGSTDVDSPTASATGGTVNYRTKTPDKDFGAMLSGSAGEYSFMRIFGKIETGEIGPWGTRAFISASTATNDNPFNNYGRVRKEQYNGRLYQPIGSNGDFVSIAGNYNQNRNNFFGSLPLRWDAGRVVGSSSSNRYPMNADERTYNINYPCTTNQASGAGAQTANSCGTEFDRRYNPSNTGNIRINSRFTLADGLVLTVDPSYQYVKANGGGTVTLNERSVALANGRAAGTTFTGVLNAGSGSGATFNPNGGFGYYVGRDLNGDGDTLDTVTGIAPSQTRTNRYGVIAGLRYDIADGQVVRLTYTHDYANHRQTGQVGLLNANGEPFDVFPVNSPLLDGNGRALQKRDRQSFAILDQVAGEYRGEFGDLTVNLGLRAPFFKRNLDQRCFTIAANGNVSCVYSNVAAYQAANPTYAPPTKRSYDYNKLLPSVGVVYHVTPDISAFASFAQGLSVPGTDPLYNSLYLTTANARPAPETTDSFDGGLRYTSRMVQASISGYFTKYNNRLASAFDPVLNETVYRNLGRVDKYGIDASFAVAPMKGLTFYAFGSLNESEIKDNVQIGTGTFAPTKGKNESGAPTYSYGAVVRGSTDWFDLGITAKRTGGRYIYDTNLPVCSTGRSVGTTAGVLDNCGGTTVFGAKAPAYWLVNLDARVPLKFAGLGDKTYLQLNVYNLFDQFYVGGFGGNLAQTGSPPFVQIGAPRTISGTVVFAF